MGKRSGGPFVNIKAVVGPNNVATITTFPALKGEKMLEKCWCKQQPLHMQVCSCKRPLPFRPDIIRPAQAVPPKLCGDRSLPAVPA